MRTDICVSIWCDEDEYLVELIPFFWSKTYPIEKGSYEATIWEAKNIILYHPWFQKVLYLRTEPDDHFKWSSGSVRKYNERYIAI